ncbi:hypothetical protein IQ227_25005, partial [Anabaena aphanizomenioides LEGE 00250]
MLIKYVQRFHLILFLLVITYGCSSNPNSKFDNKLNEWMNSSKIDERNIRQKKMFDQLYGWDKAREKGMKYCKLLTEGVTEQEILVTESLAVEGATKELKRLLDKHYSPQTLLIKWHLIANRCHHFQDQFLAL